jgi:hypothetical protein
MEYTATVIECGEQWQVLFNDDNGKLYTGIVANVTRETIAELIAKLSHTPLNRVRFDSEYNKGRREHTVHYFRYAVFQF